MTVASKTASAHVAANADRAKEARAENRRRMSQADRYAAGVFYRVSGLLGTVRALDDARNLMAAAPGRLSRGMVSISREIWVDYHYAHFTVSLSSLPDIGVVLAATVHQLGLAKKHCTMDVVSSHDKIRSTPTAAALKSMIKSIQRTRERRNAHIHRGERVDIAELDDSERDDFLWHVKGLSFINSVAPGTYPSNAVRAAWREAMRSIGPRLDAETSWVASSVGSLFTALKVPFTLRYETLRKLTPSSGTA